MQARDMKETSYLFEFISGLVGSLCAIVFILSLARLADVDVLAIYRPAPRYQAIY